jgi:hypothetical protein
VRNDSYNRAISSYEEGLIDADEITSEFRQTTEEQITNIANLYNVQAAREAERVDALVAGGALGGNAYRAYQAHAQVSRDLSAQASGQIAEISINASKTLMDTYAAVGQANQTFTAQSMSTIASIAGMQADAALGFSQLLSSVEISSQQLLQGLMDIQLRTFAEMNAYDLSLRQLDLERELAQLDADTRLEIARIGSGRNGTARRSLINVSVFGVDRWTEPLFNQRGLI